MPIAISILCIGLVNMFVSGVTDPELTNPPLGVLQALGTNQLRSWLYGLSIVPALVLPVSILCPVDVKKYPLLPYLIAVFEVYAAIFGGVQHLVMLIEYSSILADGGTVTLASDLLGRFGSVELAMTVYTLASLAGIYTILEFLALPNLKLTITCSEA
jgi:hypothetical protein